MHLTGIKPTTDTAHASHCITEYFSSTKRDDPLHKQQQISTYIAYNNTDDVATGPNLGAQWAKAALTGRKRRASAPPTPTATPTLDVPPTPKLPPRVNNNAGIVHILGDTINPAIITQPHLLNEQPLQITSTTIDTNAAAPAWSLQPSVILYNRCYYTPAPSPLL
jgi:hypothetical protein